MELLFRKAFSAIPWYLICSREVNLCQGDLRLTMKLQVAQGRLIFPFYPQHLSTAIKIF